jgi:hypothetical protein
MQNTFYPEDKLKKIERLIFKFIWNGPDKIKRRVLMGSYSSGGLKAPNIFIINDTCKMKQAIRCSFSNHSMAAVQNTSFDLRQLHHTSASADKFVTSAIKTLNKIGNKVLSEINNVTNDELINKKHFDFLSQANIKTIAKIVGYNPIQEAYLRAEMRQFGIQTLREVYILYRDHRTPQASEVINRIQLRMLIALEKTVNEEVTANNDDNMIPIKVNIFRRIGKIKSADLAESEIAEEDRKLGSKLTMPREQASLFSFNRTYRTTCGLTRNITWRPTSTRIVEITSIGS